MPFVTYLVNADWQYVKALLCHMTTLTTALRWTSTISFLPAKVPGNTCIPGISAKVPKPHFKSGCFTRIAVLFHLAV